MSIDDFALKRRHQYGSILLDLETGQTVDLIESRQAECVANWLKKFPNIELVSRDGSIPYKKAISEAHPNALQVSDRFHLVKGLSEYIRLEIVSLLPRIIVVKSNNESFPGKVNEQIKPKNVTHKTTLKLQLIKQVNERFETCPSLTELSKEFKLDYRTIKKYLSGEIPTDSKQRSSSLDPVKEDIEQWISQRISVAMMHKKLVKRGIKTSYSNLRDYVRKIRSNKPKDNAMKTINRYDLIKMLYNKGIADLGLSNARQEDIKKYLKENHRIQTLIDHMTEFRIALSSQSNEKLKQWMHEVESYQYKYVQKFIKGMKRDMDAVVNGVLLDASNGKIEGKINKLKKVKREMYGRGSFELLKTKFFLIENQSQ